MSNLIGKKIKFAVYVQEKDEDLIKFGIIHDKFGGHKKFSGSCPNGIGGTSSMEHYVSIDYYSLEVIGPSSRIFVTVPCSELRIVEIVIQL